MTKLSASDIDWGSTPPDGRAVARLLDDAEQFIRRYVVLTDDQAAAVTLWAAHTHVIDAADCTPYLHVTAATKRAGKTRLLEVLEPLVRQPWLTGRTSAAALVRKTHTDRPTLLLDESDAALGRDADREYTEALRGVLGSGYRRSGRATTCVGQGASITTRDFHTFGARAIAGIGRLPDTVADRAIQIVLRRRLPSEWVARWRERDGHAAAGPLREAAEQWSARAVDSLRSARPAMPNALDDRAADVWEPLVAIADQAGPDWSARARATAVALSVARDDTDPIVELLTDIRDVLGDQQEGVIASSILLERLTALDGRPWAEWRAGRPLTARGLARLLGSLGIHADRHETSIGRVRGYRLDPLREAMGRYVAPSPPVQASMCPRANKDDHDLADPICPLGTDRKHEIEPARGSGTHGRLDRGGGTSAASEDAHDGHDPVGFLAWPDPTITADDGEQDDYAGDF